MYDTIPGTIVDTEARALRWHSAFHPWPHMRAYRAGTSDGTLQAIVSHDPCEKNGVVRQLWHVSVSHIDRNDRPDRLPTWDELKSAKYTLVPADIPMVLIFPTKPAPYVNSHPTTLHLWEAEEGIDR